MPRHYKRTVRPLIVPIGPSIAYVSLTKGMYSLIDRDDAAIVGLYNWCAHTKSHTGKSYAVREEKDNDGRPHTIRIHTLLLGGMADHRNLNSLDNRRSNIRLATYSDNNRNKSLGKNNTSGLKGAFWHSTKKKWIFGIRVGGKTKHLGSFNTAEEAHLAYRAAAILYSGEFARF